MMKKIKILIACIFAMMFSVHTAGAAIPVIDDTSLLPSVAGRGEMFSNSSFESDSSWNFYKGSSYSTDFSFEGTRSVCMSVNTEGHTYISQGKRDLSEGAVYQISARVYQPEAKGDFRIGNEYYGTASSWIGHENWKRELTAGSWTQVSATFTVPEGTKSAIIYFWLYNSGNKAYIDDVSLVMVKEPERVTVTTDQTYYYTNDDVTHGTARIIANTSQYSDYTSWKLKLSLIGENSSVLYTMDNITLADKTIHVDYPLDYLTNRNIEYKVLATVYDSGGNILEEHSMPVFRKFQRPSMIDASGNFVVNGERFVPVIGYWVYNQSDFYTQAKAMGINVIETTWGNMDKPYEVIAELDRLQANGFMGIISLYYGEETGWNEKYREDTKELIDRIKEHPAVFAYCLMDEPIAKKIDLCELGEAYEYIRSVDTVHPVYACDMFANSTEYLSKYHDVVCFDKYPASSSSSLSYVENCYSEAEFFIRNQKKPKLSILKFYQDTDSMYFPTPDDMRNMLYQNYMLGAKGHGFYPVGWTNIVDTITGETVRNLDTDTAAAVKEWNSKESEVFKNTFIFENSTMTCSGSDSSMEWYMFEDGAEVYLILRNKTMSAFDADIQSVTFTSGMVIMDDYGSENSLTLYDGRAELTLAAGGAYLYRIAAEDMKVIIDSHDDTTYSYSAYKYNGNLYIDAENKTTYITKTITIESPFIKGNMLTEHISGDGVTVSELKDGLIKLRVPKSTTASYALVTDRGKTPVPYYDGKVITSLTGGETIKAASPSGITTFIALYEGDRLITIAKSDIGESVSLTLPDNIKQENYVKLMRWDGLTPISHSVKLTK